MGFTTDRRLWLTADKERVVEEGDPDAAFLFVSAGKEVSDEDASRYGLDAPAPAPAPEPEPEKQADPPADKQAKRAKNKGA